MKKFLTTINIWKQLLSMRRLVLLWLLFCFCCLYMIIAMFWPSVETAIDRYIDEKHHPNYDYYEDLPSDVIHKKNQPITVSLLKKLKRVIGSSASFSSSSSSSSSGSKDLKVVLFWTSWFQKAWWIRLGRGGLDLEGGHCPETRCEFTHDKSRLKEAAAILFQSQRIFSEKLPSSRSLDQRWVWVHVEPPTASAHGLAMLSTQQDPDLWHQGDLSPYFNWTMTYHPTSDIMEPYGALLPYHPTSDIMEPYGALLPIDYNLAKGKTQATANASEFEVPPSNLNHSWWVTPSMRPALLDQRSVAYRKYQLVLHRSPSLKDLMESTWEPNLHWDTAKIFSWSFLATKRRRLVVWVSSHCPTASKREDYVDQLKHHVNLHVYGTCGIYRCGSKQSHRDDRCWRQIFARKYLFYLAFENSMCNAYVTEKLWRPLVYGLVPIVIGGANYSHFLPPNSYINALDYTPEDLGQFLKDLEASPDDYIQYHLWRVFWKASLRPPLCELCLKIHNDTTQVIQRDIPGWWQSVGQCDNPAKWPLNNMS